MPSVPIRFQDISGRLSDDPSGAPVVEVVLRFDPLTGSGRRTIEWTKKTIALIDSGADLNAIDPSFLSETNLPALGVAHAMGATSTIKTTRHVGHLFFPEIGLQFETDFLVVPLRDNRRHYDALIGRLVLSRGALILDYIRNDFRLEFQI
ncbi:retropepsin-like aspartic protease [Allorhizobium pseudoryzae]|uniref:retropepsin-like aspartic protease n=1 Tax=Allorhizobium pseudoryzae TaxID=379684 RepID=UPI003D05081D